MHNFAFVGKYELTNRSELLAQQKDKYGPIIKTKMGPYWFVHVFDPDDIETVFRSDSKYPERFMIPLLSIYEKRMNRIPGVATL